MAAKKNPKKADPMLGALAASFGPAKPVPGAPADQANVAGNDSEGGGGEPALQKQMSPPPTPVPALEIEKPSTPLAEKPPAIATARTETAGGGGVKKTTVSFHESEQDKIDLILDSLKRSRRHRGGFSDAIKIALRLCPLDDESIGRAWDEARAQDQRVLRHRRNS